MHWRRCCWTRSAPLSGSQGPIEVPAVNYDGKVDISLYQRRAAVVADASAASRSSHWAVPGSVLCRCAIGSGDQETLARAGGVEQEACVAVCDGRCDRRRWRDSSSLSSSRDEKTGWRRQAGPPRLPRTHHRPNDEKRQRSSNIKDIWWGIMRRPQEKEEEKGWGR